MRHQSVNSRGNHNYNAYIYDGVRWDTHFHRNFELHYAMSGRNTVVVNGRSLVMDEGELLLIPPNFLHGFSVRAGTKLWVGVFSEDFIPDYAKRNGGRLYAPFRPDPATETYLREVLFYQGVPELYTARSALYAVCAQCEARAQPEDDGRNDEISGRILCYISEHFTEEITMQGAARDLGYEYHYFSKLVHDCFSLDFRRLVNLCRFERACEFLQSTDRDLTEIALESGFQSIRSFNRVFKLMAGQTPGEYRAGKKREEGVL